MANLLQEIVLTAGYVAVAGSSATKVGADIPLHVGGGLYADQVSASITCTASTITVGNCTFRWRAKHSSADTGLTVSYYDAESAAGAPTAGPYTMKATANSRSVLFAHVGGFSGKPTICVPLLEVTIQGATTGDGTYAVVVYLWKL